MPIAILDRWTIPPTADRSELVYGTYKPSIDTTGVLPGVVRTTVTGNVTLDVAGTTYENKTVNGRISVKAANVTIRNCEVNGGVSAVAAGLINCANVAVSNCLIEDCTIYLTHPNYGWNGIVGHDFTARRCNIYGAVDGIEVYNTAAAQPYNSGVIIEGCWIHDYVWWTAASSGVVHPTDTETHNDLIQHMGGSGTIIRGNFLDAAFARQQGHWQVTALVEPYVTVPLHSLSDGGPYQAIPDRGTGTEATGRYNYDDNCCIMLNSNYGASNGLTIEDNWLYGGNYAINGGGNPYGSDGISLGSIKRNKFDRKQGDQQSGGNTTMTVTLFGGWSGHVDCPTTGVDANVYEDDNSYVTVRP